MAFQDIFFQMLSEGRNIKDIVKYGAEVLGNPLMLLDSTFHVIAFHTYGKVEDDLWNDTITEGKKEIREKYTEQVWVEELMRRVHQKKKPIITDYDENRIRRVVNQIMVGKRIIGYIVCIESRQTFYEDITERTDLVCKALSIALQQMHSYETTKTDGEPFDEIIRSLITGTDSAEEYHQAILDHIFKRTTEYYYVAAARYIQQDPAFSYTEFFYMKEHLELHYERLRAIYYDQGVLILFTADNEDELNRVINQLSVVLHSYHMLAGLSNPFSDICEIQMYYRQAIRALETADKIDALATINRFSDVVLYDILLHIPENISLKEYIHPALEKLRQYDAGHGTDYISTLYEYILLNSNISQVAKKLFTHRNTIVRRIEKISEICACDINNGEEQAKLIIGYKILALLRERG